MWQRLMATALMAVVMSSISRSTVDCNCIMFRRSSKKLYLMKTFMVKMLYYCVCMSVVAARCSFTCILVKGVVTFNSANTHTLLVNFSDMYRRS